jgi:hypothetical protein
MFGGLSKELGFTQNYEILSQHHMPRKLDYALARRNVIPLVYFPKRLFDETYNQERDQIALNRRIRNHTIKSFDLLRAIARNDTVPKNKYYLGVITDFHFWKYTFYIKNGNHLENEKNFLSSKVFFNPNRENSYINEMFSFTKRLNKERNNFEKYKAE